MADPLTADEVRELSQLYSTYISRIHRLAPIHTQTLMNIDEHLRGDNLTKADLEALRSIDKGEHP